MSLSSISSAEGATMQPNVRSQGRVDQRRSTGDTPRDPSPYSTVYDDVPEVCKKHVTETMKMFCLGCKETLCTLCYIERHKNHKFMMVSDVRPEIQKDATRLNDGILTCRKLDELVIRDMKDFTDNIDLLEQEVTRQAEQMKATIDQHRDTLIEELRATRVIQQSQSDNLRTKIKDRSADMKNSKMKLERLLSTASVSELTREMTSLHNTSGELLQLDVLQSAVTDLAANKVHFTPSKLSRNMVGKVTANVKTSSDTGRLKHVIRKGHPVGGVTSLGNLIFVVRCRNNERIEVFNADTFTADGYLPVPGLSALPWCMSSCPVNGCLYVCDDCNALHRVDVPQFRRQSSPAPTKTRWTVGSTPTGVSVNRLGNVIVACYGLGRLQEYTRGGQFVREIILRGDMKSPLHAVQLANGMFLVCHGQWGKSFKVGVVALDGKLMGTLSSSGDGQVTELLGSSTAVVARGGMTVVCEWQGLRRRGTDRVLVLNRSLSGARDLLVTVDGGIDQPWAICLDESRGRLYVGEQRGGRVLVFDNVLMAPTSNGELTVTDERSNGTRI